MGLICYQKYDLLIHMITEFYKFLGRLKEDLEKLNSENALSKKKLDDALKVIKLEYMIF